MKWFRIASVIALIWLARGATGVTGQTPSGDINGGEIRGIVEGLPTSGFEPPLSSDPSIARRSTAYTVELLSAYEGRAVRESFTVGWPSPLNREQAGAFQFTSVAPGTYLVRVKSLGPLYRRDSVRAVRVSPQQTSVITISELGPCEGPSGLPDADVAEAVGLAIRLTAPKFGLTRVFADSIPATWLSALPAGVRAVSAADLEQQIRREKRARFLSLKAKTGTGCAFVSAGFGSAGTYRGKSYQGVSSHDDYVLRPGEYGWDFDVVRTEVFASKTTQR